MTDTTTADRIADALVAHFDRANREEMANRLRVALLTLAPDGANRAAWMSALLAEAGRRRATLFAEVSP